MFLYSVKAFFSKYKYGITFNKGSYQHFTYMQWKKNKHINNESFCLCVVSHPQERIVSSYYFLGYNKCYNFIDFLKKIKDGSLLSSIRFSGFRSIVEQHFRSMHEYVSDSNGNIKANYILRKESLDKDWRRFCRIKGLKYNSLQYIIIQKFWSYMFI